MVQLTYCPLLQANPDVFNAVTVQVMLLTNTTD